VPARDGRLFAPGVKDFCLFSEFGEKDMGGAGLETADMPLRKA